MNSFDDIIVEDLLGCDGDQYSAGIRARLYYAPASFFNKINLPQVGTSLSSFTMIKNLGLQFNTGYDWSCIDVLLEEAEAKVSVEGTKQRKKIKSSLDFFMLGLKPQILGFLRLYKNIPMVFKIITNTGQTIIIGNLTNRAFIDKAEGQTAKKYDENTGYSCSISCNAPFYFFRN